MRGRGIRGGLGWVCNERGGTRTRIGVDFGFGCFCHMLIGLDGWLYGLGHAPWVSFGR
jgi:hypothetical protein